ncbi:hypothetical protein [Photorhabdus temperata]|uniref:hypothetical protein n=1 Tax=Photorhabdus temperata TaxID=574560 RepID=UPI00068513C6|nr:hypothetical protein [Photorhabdus temperata]
MYAEINNWINYTDNDADLKEYDAQYQTIDKPFSANHMHDDDFFAYWRLAGNNPVSIHGVTSLPSNFPLTEEQYHSVMGEDDSLSDALKEKRIYMLDYNNISSATAEEGVSKPATDNDSISVISVVGYSYAPMALFSVSKKR